MGVHKLWDLLTATAVPVRVESLFGKVCCVDASFWISHCLASESYTRHGGDVIAVFFLRICYLLDKGIKPVFVFDGKSPFAKLKTILKRKLINQKSVTNHKLLAFKMLASQLKNSNKYKIPSAIHNDNLVDNNDYAINENDKGFIDNEYDDMNDGIANHYDYAYDDLSNSHIDTTNTYTNSTSINQHNDSADYNVHVNSSNIAPLPDDIQYDRQLNTEADVNLLDLFPEEFLNKSEDEFEEEFKMLIDCDFLSAKSKYDIINAVRDNIIQKDREIFTSLKDKIHEYSDKQIKSYMRDVKINNEIDQLKKELNERYLHLYQPRVENYNYRNNLCDEVYDYNEYFDRKYSFNRLERLENEIKNESSNSNSYNNEYNSNRNNNARNEEYQYGLNNTSSDTTTNNNYSNSGNSVSYRMYDNKNTVTNDKKDNIKSEIDDSIYATDDMLFGEEMLSGLDENNENKKQSNRKDDNELDFKEVEIIDANDSEVLNTTINNNISYESTLPDKHINVPNKADNNFFLEMYKKHFATLDDTYLDIDRDTDTDNDNDNSNSNDETSNNNKQVYLPQGFYPSDADRKNPDTEINTNCGYYEPTSGDFIGKYNLNDKENEDIYDHNHVNANEINVINDRESSEVQKTRRITEHTDSHGLVVGQKHQYYENVQSLLDRFGVPYLVAPSEAESQCAHMNMVGDCYAVISDDSDSLVFGAKTLLKNFYNDNVFELYTSDRIKRELGIGREQLALIAVICGCDYTNGVRGIGIVNALEVIKAYPKFEDLYEFKQWATNDCSIDSATYDECPIRNEYKKKHINYRIHWTFSSDFPNKEAYDLFMNPKVSNEYKLKWDKPDMDLLIEFMSKKSSLEIKQVTECLKILFSKKSQQFIMEDMLPELPSKPVTKTAIKNYRINMNANLSAFRKVLSNIKDKVKNKNRFNMRSNRLHERNHTLSKIRSKRMVDSIKTIKRRYRKNINNDL